MDIEIDIASIRELTAHEYDSTRADIASMGVYEALGRSQERHDARLAAAPDAPTLACKAGCFWCCYYSVDVRPVEIFRILAYVAREISDEERRRIASEAQANSALLSRLDEEERARRNIKCPFLAAGRCTIYAVRPQTCRNYHATNAAGCQLSYEQPDNLDIDPDFAPFVYQWGRAHVDAFSKALTDAGFDTWAYELNAALAAAMNDPEGKRRVFEAGQRVFPELEGMQVEPEFMGWADD
jgi:Fe-S-cluster containining protein